MLKTNSLQLNNSDYISIFAYQIAISFICRTDFLYWNSNLSD